MEVNHNAFDKVTTGMGSHYTYVLSTILSLLLRHYECIAEEHFFKYRDAINHCQVSDVNERVIIKITVN